MGGYLIAMIPVALCLAFVAQDRALKAGLLLVSFGLVFCLAATYSRGAWLGLAAGLLVFAAAFARWPELMPRPAVIGMAVACVTLPFALLLPSVLSRVQLVRRPSRPGIYRSIRSAKVPRRCGAPSGPERSGPR